MKATPSPHPDENCLAGFIAGSLTLEQMDLIASHVGECRECCLELARLTDVQNDPLLNRLRDVHQSGPALDVQSLRDEVSGPKTDLQTRPVFDLPPDAIPGYEIVEEIGRGGMGAVYKAQDLQLKRFVALKVILAGTHSTPKQREQFQTEAETIACLDHPNIVQIYEVGEHQGRPYFAMELIERGNLHEATSRRPQNTRFSAKIVRQLAQAVHYAHAKGVIHRDLKPDNVLMKTLHEPKITDFGLAKQIGSDRAHTRTGTILGTPNYMSPEQTTGRAYAIGIHADIYSLGTILYELLTGHVPFQSDSPWETMRMVREEEPIPPNRLQPKLSGDVQTICLKCLTKEPRKRYASAEALADDLGRFLNGEPILARPVGRIERIAKWTKRRPAIAALVLVAVLGATGVISQWKNAVAARRDEAQQRRESQGQLAKFRLTQWVERADEGDLFGSLDWLRQSFDAEHGSLDNAPEAQTQRETLFRERTAATLESLPRLQRLWFPNRGAREVQFDLDGKRVLIVAREGPARVYDVETGEPFGSPLGAPDSMVVSASFSPDGSAVATADSQGAVRLWHVGADRLTAQLIAQTTGVRRVQFSRDGKLLAVRSSKPEASEEQSSVAIWRLADGQLVARPEGVSRAGCFSADSRWFITSGRSRILWWNVVSDEPGEAVASGLEGMIGTSDDRRRILLLQSRGICISESKQFQVTRRLDPPQHRYAQDNGANARRPIARNHKSIDLLGRPSVAAFAPGNRWVAIGFSSGKLGIWDSENDELKTVPLPGQIAELAFSPCGRYLAAVSGDHHVRIFSVASGKPAFPPLPHGGMARLVAFHPDSRYLLTASEDGSVRLWDLAAQQPHMILDHLNATSAGFDPRGRFLVTAGLDGDVRFWSVDGKQEVAPTLSHSVPIERLQFSADGSRMLVACPHEIHLWNRTAEAESWERILRKRNDRAAVSLSADGRVLAIEGAREGNEWGVVDVSNGWILAEGTSNLEHRFVLSPNRRWGASAPRTALWLSDLNAPELQSYSLPVSGMARRSVFSPDSRTLLSLSGAGTSQLWDVQTRQELLQFAIRGGYAAAFRPDGQRVAIGSNNGELRFFETVGGRESSDPIQLHARLIDLLYSPDGRRLLTVHADRTVRVWDADDGFPITPSWTHTHQVRHVEFHPDSQSIVTVCDDGVARIWMLPSPTPLTSADLERLCELLGVLHEDGKPPRDHRFAELWRELSHDYPGLFRSSRSMETWLREQMLLSTATENETAADYFELMQW